MIFQTAYFNLGTCQRRKVRAKIMDALSVVMTRNVPLADNYYSVAFVVHHQSTPAHI